MTRAKKAQMFFDAADRVTKVGRTTRGTTKWWVLPVAWKYRRAGRNVISNA